MPLRCSFQLEGDMDSSCLTFPCLTEMRTDYIMSLLGRDEGVLFESSCRRAASTGDMSEADIGWAAAHSRQEVESGAPAHAEGSRDKYINS